MRRDRAIFNITRMTTIEEGELVKHIGTMHTITCDRCGGEGNQCNIDTLDLAAQLFYKQGWRKKNGNVYCQYCVKSPNKTAKILTNND